MSKDASVAPKERINVTFKPDTGDAGLNKELPLKMMVIGDFTGKEDGTPVEDRPVINVNKDNIDDVIKQQGISLNLDVKNKLEDSDEELSVDLKIDSIKDFGPDAIVQKVPELKKLLELRQALESLKGPLGNVPEFRKSIEKLLGDEESREKLLKELDITEQ